MQQTLSRTLPTGVLTGGTCKKNHKSPESTRLTGVLRPSLLETREAANTLAHPPDRGADWRNLQKKSQVPGKHPPDRGADWKLRHKKRDPVLLTWDDLSS